MLAVITAVVAVGLFFVRNRQRLYDPAFDTTLSEPAYGSDGPVVIFDEGHRNSHTAAGAYKPLADLIRSDGYRLRVTRQPLTTAVLSDASVLVIVLARGAHETNDDPAFTESEVVTLDQWIRAGGSLLLVTDHWPYGAAVASLASRFDVQMGSGLVEDPAHHDADRGASHLVFSRENGLLRDHPIVRGRNEAERIRRVLTFTGQSIQGPANSVPFLALSDSAIEWPPTEPRVDKDGGNVRVRMEYGEAVSARGRAQGMALELGEGRVIVLGEAGMLRAHRGPKDERVGMNVPGYDNRQLGLNILHWLSRIL